MAKIHDPSSVISGPLSASASGALNIYPFGNMTNKNPRGTPPESYWSQDEGNITQQLLLDIVNSGTVPLFGSASRTDTHVSGVDAYASSTNAYASSSFSTNSGSIAAMSASLTGANFIVNYTKVNELSTSLSSTTNIVANPTTGLSARQDDLEWTMYGNDPVLHGQSVITGTFGVYGISGTLFGIGVTPNGMSGVLSDLSTSYYSSDIPGNAVVSGALHQTAYAFFGTQDLAALSGGTGGSTGSHPVSAYNNLREAFYTLTSSFDALSGNLDSSASAWNQDDQSFATLSGNLNSSASIWNGVVSWTGSINTVTSSFNDLSGNLDSSASIWNANTTGNLSTSFYTLSGNLDSSASIWNAVSSAFYPISGTYTAVSGAASSSVVTGSELSGVLYPLSTSFYAISGTYTAVSGAASSSVVTGSELSGVLYPLSTSFYVISGTYTEVSGAASSSVVTGSELSGVLYPLSMSFYEISGTYTAVSGAASSSVVTGSELSGVLYPMSESFYAISGTYTAVSGAASSSVATGSALSGILYPMSTSFYPLSSSVSGVFNSSSLAPSYLYFTQTSDSSSFIFKVSVSGGALLVEPA